MSGEPSQSPSGDQKGQPIYRNSIVTVTNNNYYTAHQYFSNPPGWFPQKPYWTVTPSDSKHPVQPFKDYNAELFPSPIPQLSNGNGLETSGYATPLNEKNELDKPWKGRKRIEEVKEVTPNKTSKRNGKRRGTGLQPSSDTPSARTQTSIRTPPTSNLDEGLSPFQEKPSLFVNILEQLKHGNAAKYDGLEYFEVNDKMWNVISTGYKRGDGLINDLLWYLIELKDLRQQSDDPLSIVSRDSERNPIEICDVFSLLPEQSLNECIIDALLSDNSLFKAPDQRTDVHVFLVHAWDLFKTRLPWKKMFDYRLCEEMLRPFVNQISQSTRTLLVPICEQEHLALLEAGTNGSVNIYDYLGPSAPPCLDPISQFLDLIKKFEDPFKDVSWKTPKFPACAHQSLGGNDCGIHVIANVQFIRNRVDVSLCHVNAYEWRRDAIKICIDLVKHTKDFINFSPSIGERKARTRKGKASALDESDGRV